MAAEQMSVMMSSETTFAQHLENILPKLSVQLKLPPWLLFPLIHHRKDQANMTPHERSRFLCALDVLISNGTFGSLVEIHSDMSHMMHGTQRFLPWHRIYLLQLENALRAIHPDVFIPYWDWTKASEQAVPSWLSSFTPTVATPSMTINVVRAPGSSSSLATLASNIPSIMLQTTFVNFWQQLEAVHGGVHVWVGGSMSSIATAPADPIFWMHHANIDRLWWKWYKSPAGTGKNPSLSGSSAVMDPWAYTESNTRNMLALGYDYV